MSDQLSALEAVATSAPHFGKGEHPDVAKRYIVPVGLGICANPPQPALAALACPCQSAPVWARRKSSTAYPVNLVLRPDPSAPNVSYRLRKGLLMGEARFDRTAGPHLRRRNVGADQLMRRRGQLVSHLRGSTPGSQAVGCRDGIAQVVVGDKPGEGAVMA